MKKKIVSLVLVLTIISAYSATVYSKPGLPPLLGSLGIELPYEI